MPPSEARPLDLLGTPPAELVARAGPAGFGPRRVRNLFRQLHTRPGVPLLELRGANQGLREWLHQRGKVAALEPAGDLVQPEDGETRKLLLRTRDGLPVETVLMPRRVSGWTVCVSSQVGCRVGCTFCRTGEMGLSRNLLAGEIVDQVRRAQALAPGPVRNVVFMGMGEPLENLDAVLAAIEVLRAPEVYAVSARRITVSTSGHLPGMRALGARNPRVNLALSLNATEDVTRDRIMPINRRYPLDALLDTLREYPLPRHGTVMIEYVLLAGVNDTPADADRLVRLLEGLPAKLNLIRYNPVPGLPYARPSDARVRAFRDALGSVGKGVLERYSWGGGIDAACGQLGSAVERPAGAPDTPLRPAAPLPWSV